MGRRLFGQIACDRDRAAFECPAGHERPQQALRRGERRQVRDPVGFVLVAIGQVGVQQECTQPRRIELQRKFAIVGPDLICGPLIERKLLALPWRVGMSRPREGSHCVRANERIRRSLARFPEMAWRSQITELVFGVAELEQHRRTVAGVGWFRECPAQLLRRGVRGTARQCRSCGLPQHGDDVAVAARRCGDQMNRDRTRVGTLIPQQLGRTRV